MSLSDRARLPAPVILNSQIKVAPVIAARRKDINLRTSRNILLTVKLQLLAKGASGILEITWNEPFVSWSWHVDPLLVGEGPDDGLGLNEVDTGDGVFDVDDFVVEFVGGVDADYEAVVVLWGADLAAAGGGDGADSAGQEGGEEERFDLHLD